MSAVLAVKKIFGRPAFWLILDCGQRYHFGSVTFSPSILKPDLLQRLSPIKPGTAFRKHRISELYRNLQDSRHFAEIDVETTPDPATHTVAVAVAPAGRPAGRHANRPWRR